MALNKIQVKLPKVLTHWLGYTKVRRLLWSLLFFCFTLGIFSLHFLPDRVPLEVGQVSPVDITANRYLTFEDEEATEKKRQEAAQNVKDVYELNPKVIEKTKSEIGANFKKVLGVSINPKLDQNEKIKALKSFNWQITDNQWQEILSLEPKQIQELEEQTKKIVTNTFSKGVNSENLQFAIDKIISEVELLEINPAYRSLIKGVLSSVEFQPNLLFNPVATEEKRKEAREAVEPVNVVIQKNERIVSAGDVLTQRQVNILTWLGYKNNASPTFIILGLALFTGLIMMLGALFLRHYRKELYRNETYLVLLMLLVVLTLVLCKLIISIKLSNIPEKADQVGHMIPVAAGTMLIAILLDTKLAIFTTVIFTMFVGLFTGQMSFVLTALTGGLVGVYSVSHLSQRSDLAKAGIWVAFANIVSVFSLGLLNNLSWKLILIGSSFGIANGILSSVLTIGLLPYLESGFGITTSVRLLELSNPNHPLLKRLLLEAPGTYHHSILVGNLGEAAADVIGAESLLVRAGAYYHDIGKVKRPYFFVENQISGENPHEKIAAPLSTLIITSHVKDGVELAKSYGLPQVIVDMVAQHHGTSLVKYFYHKALENEKEDTIKEEDFRYDAPKPQSKEAAIIMLADSVEAAVRSVKQPTPGKIEGMVRNIIKERLNDGQLDECDLTFKDLDKIANAFVRVLNGIFHSRIEYPESILKAMEKKKKGEKDGTDNKQPAAKSSNSPSVGG
ncbi:MAG: cyclic-di-AMP phosphodiesterase PgpH [Clostridia bacterium]|nr:cyclic-di-AMP phosphodiesterase PgpH [Clostridia bacterium]MDN5321772.1 cyclic-di-AMP phosphodiesterase PgpH [Clostridia bacterium]